MPPHVRPRPSSSQLAGNDGAELQSPTADRLVGHVDTTLGKHVLDVAVAQGEAEIEPEGLLDDDARIAVAVVWELVHKQTLHGPCAPSQRVTVTVPVRLATSPRCRHEIPSVHTSTLVRPTTDGVNRPVPDMKWLKREESLSAVFIEPGSAALTAPGGSTSHRPGPMSIRQRGKRSDQINGPGLTPK